MKHWSTSYHECGTERLPSKRLELTQLLQIVDPRLRNWQALLLGVVLRLAFLHMVADGLPQILLSHISQQGGRHEILYAPRLPRANTETLIESVFLQTRRQTRSFVSRDGLQAGLRWLSTARQSLVDVQGSESQRRIAPHLHCKALLQHIIHTLTNTAHIQINICIVMWWGLKCAGMI